MGDAGTELVLETRKQQDRTSVVGQVALTLELGDDYWLYRVRLGERQAIVAFPKFFSIGVGFAVEPESWNCNLPWRGDAYAIFDHIKVNKGDDAITDEDCVRAIRMIQDAIKSALGGA